MKPEDKELLLRDLCERLPHGVKYECSDVKNIWKLNSILTKRQDDGVFLDIYNPLDLCKPYLFPLSNITEEEYAIYLKIWEDAGKMAYLEGCHHLIINIKAYKAANDYLLSKHYDINGLIPKGLAIDATHLNIY